MNHLLGIGEDVIQSSFAWIGESLLLDLDCMDRAVDQRTTLSSKLILPFSSVVTYLETRVLSLW